MSIVGYDDDFNGGSYLLMNNWGDGLYWAAYSLFRKGAGLADASHGTPVMFCRVKKDYSPKLTLKISMTHDQRNKVALLTGVATALRDLGPFYKSDKSAAMASMSEVKRTDILGRSVDGAKRARIRMVSAQGL